MEAVIRPAHPEEMEQYGTLAAYVYAGRYGDTADNLVARSMHPDWTLCAFVDDRMVAAHSTLPLTMRLNGRAVKLGGISAVGTIPEYRRQGFIRRIMQGAFADMRQRRQSIAALWASQAAIYQRYGFAMATRSLSYTVHPRDINFTLAQTPQGVCRRQNLADGYALIRQLYIDFISQRMGYLHRSRALWQNNALAEHAADGPVHIAVYCDTDEHPQGYLVYTTRALKVPDAARPQEMIIRDFAWLTLDAYVGLWSFVTRHDLVGRVHYPKAPADDPALELFEEPRLLYPQSHEGIWLRVVDVTEALQERGYHRAGRLILDVSGDDMAPWNNGRFTLETDGHTTRVQPTTAPPDIRLSIKALASLYSGFRTARTLANWGLLAGNEDGIDRAERVFHTRYAPHCPDHF